MKKLLLAFALLSLSLFLSQCESEKEKFDREEKARRDLALSKFETTADISNDPMGDVYSKILSGTKWMASSNWKGNYKKFNVDFNSNGTSKVTWLDNNKIEEGTWSISGKQKIIHICVQGETNDFNLPYKEISSEKIFLDAGGDLILIPLRNGLGGELREFDFCQCFVSANDDDMSFSLCYNQVGNMYYIIPKESGVTIELIPETLNESFQSYTALGNNIPKKYRGTYTFPTGDKTCSFLREDEQSYEFINDESQVKTKASGKYIPCY